MPFTTLISAKALANHVNNPNWAVMDCRFSLDDTEKGRRDYRQEHIPGALYAHLDEDLSGLVTSGKTGRHPLPEVDVFTRKLCNWGIDEDVQVVAYDDMGGGVAARLWWMLRWLGHDNVAVLDGGWRAWIEADLPTTTDLKARSSRLFSPKPDLSLVVEQYKLRSLLEDVNYVVIDARAPERYRGEMEIRDPVAGHIAGAVNVPFAGNLTDAETFHDVDTLKQRYQHVLGERKPEQAVCYCGSGVTAAHNILGMAHAGLGMARLYPGSWSEWVTDPNNPIVTADGN